MSARLSSSNDPKKLIPGTKPGRAVGYCLTPLIPETKFYYPTCQYDEPPKLNAARHFDWPIKLPTQPRDSPSKDQVRLKWLSPCCYLIRDVYRGHFSGQRFFTSMCMIGEFKSSEYIQLYLRAIHVQVVLSNCRKSLPTRIKRRWRRFGHLQVNRFNAFKRITSKSTLLISLFC
jgi:hypothetical protein